MPAIGRHRLSAYFVYQVTIPAWAIAMFASAKRRAVARRGGASDWDSALCDDFSDDPIVQPNRRAEAVVV